MIFDTLDDLSVRLDGKALSKLNDKTFFLLVSNTKTMIRVLALAALYIY